jgi:hypothetical protein
MINWKRIRKIALYASCGAALAAIVLLLVSQQVRLSKLAQNLSERTGAIVEELRTKSEASDETRQNVILLAEDTNKILEALRLPQRTLSFEDSVEGEDPIEEISAFLVGVDEIEAAWNKSRSSAARANLADFLKNSLTPQLYTIANLDSESIDVLITGDKAFNITTAQDGSIALTAITKKQKSFPAASGELVESIIAMTSDVQSFIAMKKEMEQALELSIESAQSDDYFASMNVVFDWSTQTVGDAVVKAANIVRKGTTLLKVYPNPEEKVFSIAEDEVSNPNDILNKIKSSLAAMDIRSREEVKIDDLRIEMTKLIDDKGFVGFIDGRGLRLVNSEREDTDYFYYDIYDEGNSRIGAFGIQKFLGELYLMDHEDIPITSIKTIQDNDVKKN